MVKCVLRSYCPTSVRSVRPMSVQRRSIYPTLWIRRSDWMRFRTSNANHVSRWTPLRSPQKGHIRFPSILSMRASCAPKCVLTLFMAPNCRLHSNRLFLNKRNDSIEDIYTFHHETFMLPNTQSVPYLVCVITQMKVTNDLLLSRRVYQLNLRHKFHKFRPEERTWSQFRAFRLAITRL